MFAGSKLGEIVDIGNDARDKYVCGAVTGLIGMCFHKNTIVQILNGSNGTIPSEYADFYEKLCDEQKTALIESLQVFKTNDTTSSEYKCYAAPYASPGMALDMRGDPWPIMLFCAESRESAEQTLKSDTVLPNLIAYLENVSERSEFVRLD